MEFDVSLVLVSCVFWTLVCGTPDVRMVTASSNSLLDDNWYFNLIEPHEISYMYKIRPAKDFGAVLTQSHPAIDMVIAEPLRACSPIANVEYIKHTIAFVERGECSFLTKVLNAEDAGALAVVISDNDKDNNSRMVDMVTDETDRQASIPAFFMLGKDGHMIRTTLQHLNIPSAIINIPVNTTGIPLHRLNMPPWTVW